MNHLFEENAGFDTSFRIEEWMVIPMQNEIFLNGKAEHVENKIMQVLVYLAHNTDRVVSREELMQKVWPENYVSEEVLTRSISILRRIFNDSADNPRIIKTIRKKGYRLISDIVFLDEDSSTRNAKKRTVGYAAAIVPLLFLIGFSVFSKEKTSEFNRWQNLPIATSKENETYPAISPDGSRVAYVTYSGEQTKQDITISITGAEGNNLRITDHSGDESVPTWSPDGRFIAYIRSEGEQSGIYKIPALGGTPERIGIPHNLIAQRMAWSPDGQKIAYVDRISTKDSYSIFLLDIESGEKTKLTRPTNQHWGDYSPSFSPDGNKLSFIRGISAGTHDIFVHDFRSGEEYRLTHDTRRTLGQTWAPDGQIIYSVSRGRTGYLWSIAEKGGKPSRLNITGKRPNIDGTGKHMVVEDWNHDYDIVSINVGENSEEPQIRVISDLNSTQEDFSPEMSNNGDKLAFISNRSGSFELYLHDKAKNISTRASTFESEYLTSPMWSSNDSLLLINMFNPEGNADIYSYDVDKQELNMLTQSVHNEISPQWAEDDKGFYYGSNQTGQWEIWYKELNNNSSKQITDNGGYSVKVSGQSKLYFTRFDSTGIWEKSLDTGLEKRIIEDLHLFDWSNFVIAQSGIYYISRRSASAGPSLKFYDIESDESSLITRLYNIPPVAGMTLSKDEKRIFITQRVRNNSDIILYKNLEGEE